MLSAASTRASLLALCFGNFVIGTGTLIVPGMLPQLADGLGVSLPIAGLLVTPFAAAVFVSAPLLAAATSRLDRRGRRRRHPLALLPPPRPRPPLLPLLPLLVLPL